MDCRYLQQKGSETALVQRWVWEMEGFSYSVEYRRGKENIADFLSRQEDVAEALPEGMESESAGAIVTRSASTIGALDKGIHRSKEVPVTECRPMKIPRLRGPHGKLVGMEPSQNETMRSVESGGSGEDPVWTHAFHEARPENDQADSQDPRGDGGAVMLDPHGGRDQPGHGRNRGLDDDEHSKRRL